MTRKQAIAISVVSALSAAGLGGAIAGPQSIRSLASGDVLALTAQSGSFGQRQHGWWRGRKGQGAGHLCMGWQDGQAEDVIGLVERLVEFTPVQAAAWAKLASTIRASGDSLRQDCARLEEAGEPATAPQQLARAEAMMVAGLVAVRQVRPAFDAFYGSLADEQRAALDGLMAHRRDHGSA